MDPAVWRDVRVVVFAVGIAADDRGDGGPWLTLIGENEGLKDGGYGALDR